MPQFHAIQIKDHLGYDDSADAWGVHGVGGLVGNILTAFFASKDIIGLDGAVNPGGAFLDGNWALLGYNAAGSAAIMGYSFVATLVILYGINIIPGLHFRPHEHEELVGGDLHEMGEVAYEIVPTNVPVFTEMKKEDTIATMI